MKDAINHQDKNKFVLDASEIFEEIPGDPSNVMMKFPPELLSALKWAEGDAINVAVSGESLVLTLIKKNNDSSTKD